jgi:hypothetical protein
MLMAALQEMAVVWAVKAVAAAVTMVVMVAFEKCERRTSLMGRRKDQVAN